MNIYGHVILSSEIIGIGPVMMQRQGDQTLWQVYNIRQLWFMLHLRHHSIRIESNWLDVGFGESPDDNERKAREDYKQFFEEYKRASNEVSALVRECVSKKRKSITGKSGKTEAGT